MQSCRARPSPTLPPVAAARWAAQMPENAEEACALAQAGFLFIPGPTLQAQMRFLCVRKHLDSVWPYLLGLLPFVLVPSDNQSSLDRKQNTARKMLETAGYASTHLSS